MAMGVGRTQCDKIALIHPAFLQRLSFMISVDAEDFEHTLVLPLSLLMVVWGTPLTPSVRPGEAGSHKGKNIR